MAALCAWLLASEARVGGVSLLVLVAVGALICVAPWAVVALCVAGWLVLAVVGIRTLTDVPPGDR